ncbi:hypothetical protein AN1V17_51560 [Vallitalea sediminicola]
MIIGFSRKPYGKGGAISWIKTFSNYCISNGHQVKFSYKNRMDVFCSVANFSLPKELRYLKNRNIKILQRLGSIFLDYNYDDKQIVIDGNNHLKQLIPYADTIVYQSVFSKKELYGSLYNKMEPDGDIIYNSTNASIFSPDSRTIYRHSNKKIILCSAYWGSLNTSLECIKLIVETAKKLQNHPEIEFWILGLAPIETEEYIRKYNLPNITKLNLHNPIRYTLMPYYLKSADLVLHLKAHEGCSNAVIETMSVGTPLVGLNSGSLPELLGDAALLADCTGDIKKFPKVDINDLVKKILITLERSNIYRSKMLKRAKSFSEEEQCSRYLSILEKLYKSKYE